MIIICESVGELCIPRSDNCTDRYVPRSSYLKYTTIYIYIYKNILLLINKGFHNPISKTARFMTYELCYISLYRNLNFSRQFIGGYHMPLSLKISNPSTL